MTGKVQFRDFLSSIAHDKDQVHRIGSWNIFSLNLFERVWLIAIFSAAFQDRFQTRRILKLLVRMRILVGLERWNCVICPQLRSHFGKD